MVNLLGNGIVILRISSRGVKVGYECVRALISPAALKSKLVVISPLLIV